MQPFREKKTTFIGRLSDGLEKKKKAQTLNGKLRIKNNKSAADNARTITRPRTRMRKEAGR
jgi:hypothetical protein